MTSAIFDWTKLILSTLVQCAGLGVMLAQTYLFWRIYRYWVYERPAINRHGPVSPRVLFRRLWCSHRVVVRGRDAYGKQSTFCASCNTDVNAGKPSEEWR